MYSVFSTETMAGAAEMLTCFFTLVVAFVSYVLTWRG